MNEQEKIELGEYIINLVLINSERGNFLKDAVPNYKLMISNSVFNKIIELDDEKRHQEYFNGFKNVEHGSNHDKTSEIIKSTPSNDTDYPSHKISNDKQHICGICYQTYPVGILREDFDVCYDCLSVGKTRQICQDKNMETFKSGDTLRNERSLTTSVKILQINENFIISEPGGCIDREDFVAGGWIVHEKVTAYQIEGSTCLTKCKFKISKTIGSTGCIFCNCFKLRNSVQKWVICELYNKEKNER